jgi:hypothetical protein
LGNLAGVVRGRALQGGVDAPVHAVAANDDLAGLGQAHHVSVAARWRGILAVADVVRAYVIIIAKGVEGVVANVAGSVAAADVVGARVAVIAQDEEHGLVRCAVSSRRVALLGTTCVSAAVVGGVHANCFSAICHTGVVCARVEVIATNAIYFAQAINFAAGLGVARIRVVALDSGEQAGGLAANVRARVVGAFVAVPALHGHDSTASHAIAQIRIANIAWVRAGDGGVGADSHGERARVVDGARVVGARVVVVAIERGYWALSGGGIASLGVARIAPGACTAFAHSAELVDESVRAGTIEAAGIDSARVSVVASLVLVDTSGGSAALSDVASMIRRARNVNIWTHSVGANVLRARVSVGAVHSRAVLASSIGSIANLREALVHSGTVDWWSRKHASRATRLPIVGASSRWVASIVRARVVVVAALGSEDAAGTVLAAIDRAQIVVVADHRRVIYSSRRVATIVCASHAIISGDVGVVTTGRVAAQVQGARIVIVARSGDSLAAVGCWRVARVDHAFGAKIAILVSVWATGSVRARRGMARIKVGAGKGSRRACTGGVVATVDDALETSAALLGIQAAAHGGVAGADHAGVGNGAKISEHAAFHGVARVACALAVVVARGAGGENTASAVHTRVDGTCVAVIADFGSELASCGGNAGVVSAFAVVIARNRGEHAATRGIAAICGALVVIIASDRGDLTSTLLAADSFVALVRRSAVGDGGVDATLGPSGGGSNLHATSIDGAIVVVVAILVDDRLRAARLARALAHAAPVLVAAVERETSSKLESRIRGVPFAVEEVQTVVVARF